MAEILYETQIDTNLPSVQALLRFDATLAENVTLPSTLTEHPIEVGAPLTDHVRLQNITVELTVVVSNTPLDRRSLISDTRIIGAQLPYTLATKRKKLVSTAKISGGVVQPYRFPGTPRFASPVGATPAVWQEVDETVGGSSLQFPSYVNRVGEVYGVLIKIRNDASLCTVLGKEKNYTSMILTNISAPTEAKDSKVFTLTFQGARFAETAETVTTKRQPLEPRAKDPVAAGPKSTKPAVDFSDLNSQAKSIAQAGGELIVDLNVR